MYDMVMMEMDLMVCMMDDGIMEMPEIMVIIIMRVIR